MLSVEYSLLTYLYIKTVAIIHTKSVFLTEIIDSSKDLQRTLAAIWWKMIRGLNIAITTRYYPTELQGENATLKQSNVIVTNLTTDETQNHWDIPMSGTSSPSGFLMIYSVIYINQYCPLKYSCQSNWLSNWIHFNKWFSFQFNQT